MRIFVLALAAVLGLGGIAASDSHTFKDQPREVRVAVMRALAGQWSVGGPYWNPPAVIEIDWQMNFVWWNRRDNEIHRHVIVDIRRKLPESLDLEIDMVTPSSGKYGTAHWRFTRQDILAYILWPGDSREREMRLLWRAPKEADF
jgi:hypothetical protein